MRQVEAAASLDDLEVESLADSLADFEDPPDSPSDAALLSLLLEAPSSELDVLSEDSFAPFSDGRLGRP